MSNEEVCVLLVDWSAGKNDQYPFHIESFRRYSESPPHWRWKMYKVFSTIQNAFEFLESKEADSLFKDIYLHPDKNGKTSRYEIMSRDNFHCCICGRGAEDGVKLEVDHRYPKSKGGTDNPENLWTLCFDCNRGKRDKVNLALLPLGTGY